MAPEVAGGTGEYSALADVYSFAITAYEVLHPRHEVPLGRKGRGLEEHKRRTLRGDRPPLGEVGLDTKLAQKLGQLQPFIAVFPQGCMGPLASFLPA
jgi:hypothetical protein